MLIRRLKFNDPQGFDEPIGIDRNGGTHRTDRIEIVPTVPQLVRASSFPEPKNLVIAAEIEFLTAQRGDETLNPHPLGTFKRQPGMERKDQARHGDGGVFGRQIPNILAIPVDNRHDLFERRLRRDRRRRQRVSGGEQSLPTVLYVSASRQAEAYQQNRNE